MLKIPDPELQIDFSGVLAEIRGQYLQDALSATVKKLDITELDKALAEFVPKPSLSMLASHGLRGELMFPLGVDGKSAPLEILQAIVRVQPKGILHHRNGRLPLSIDGEARVTLRSQCHQSS